MGEPGKLNPSSLDKLIAENEANMARLNGKIAEIEGAAKMSTSQKVAKNLATKKNDTIAFVLAGGLLGLSLRNYYAKQEYQTELEALERQRDALSAQNASLEERNTVLSNEISDMRASLSAALEASSVWPWAGGRMRKVAESIVKERTPGQDKGSAPEQTLAEAKPSEFMV